MSATRQQEWSWVSIALEVVQLSWELGSSLSNQIRQPEHLTVYSIFDLICLEKLCVHRAASKVQSCRRLCPFPSWGGERALSMCDNSGPDDLITLHVT